MVDLIDQDGNFWAVNDPRLSRRLGGRLTGSALASYAVLNLGFVSVSVSDRFIRLACRPATLSPQTLAATLHLVYEHPLQTIGLDYFAGTWNHLVLRDRTKLRCFIAGLATPRSLRLEASFLRKALTPEASPLRWKLDGVRRILANAACVENLREPLNKILAGRWSLYALDPESGESFVRALGDSYTPFNPLWLASAVGRPLSLYADESYGRWVAQHHRNTLAAGNPQFDMVDAIISFPRIGEARARYSRMTLPVAVAGLANLVLSAAVIDSAIDLRSSGFDKAS